MLFPSKLLSLLAALIFLAGCQAAYQPGVAVTGTLLLEVSGEDSGRLLSPQDSTTPAQYVITITGSGAPAPLTIGAGTAFAPISLPPGSYSITADAYNAAGLALARGSKDFSISGGVNTQVSLILSPLAQNGTFRLEAKTLGLGLTTPGITATLTSESGVIPLTLTEISGLWSAEKSVAPGSYRLSAHLLDGTAVRSTGAETVFILAGATTYGGITYYNGASILSSITVEAPQVIGGGTTPTAAAPVITLTPQSTVNMGTEVTITMTAEAGAEIRYTLDGTNPTATSPLYSAPVKKTYTAAGTQTIKAFAKASGKADSPITSQTITVKDPNQTSTYFSTNPNGQKGKAAAITIDGAFSDWTDDMIIAQGAANDDARMFKGSHEGPVYDLYTLSAAWDDTSLYLKWQYTNVTDVSDPAQGFPISDNGKPWNGNIPISLAFDVDPAVSVDGTLLDKGKVVSVWGDGVYNTFANGADRLAMFSAKPGVGQPAVFWPNASGSLDYGTEFVKLFSTVGITYKWGDGYFSTKPIYGVNSNGWAGYKPSDLADSTKFVDFLTKGHSKTQDTAYEMKIPYAALGITKALLESQGIGVMLISTFGQSGIDSLPKDMATLDKALDPYGPDASTSAEKNDSDNFTEPMARVGK